MWFGLAKMALNAGTHIYKKRQETKMAMSDARLMHAQKMASGEESYQGKLLEARQNDYKDEFVLLILSAPIIILAWGVFSDNPETLLKIDMFFIISCLPYCFCHFSKSVYPLYQICWHKQVPTVK